MCGCWDDETPELMMHLDQSCFWLPAQHDSQYERSITVKTAEEPDVKPVLHHMRLNILNMDPFTGFYFKKVQGVLLCQIHVFFTPTDVTPFDFL